MAKPILYEWALDQTSLPPTSQAQWEEGFQYLNAATGGKVPTYVHDYPFSEITKAVRWTINAIPENGIEVVNRLKGNQNPVVEGSTDDPLPSATQTDYAVNAEPAAGYTFITAATDVTFTGGQWNGAEGILRRAYAKDAAGLINKNSQYGGVKLPDGTQLQAQVDDIATNGVRITDDSSNVYVDVDLGNATINATGFKFSGLSESVGVWPDIGDEDSTGNSPVTLAFLDAGWGNGASITVDNIRQFKYITLMSEVTSAATAGQGIAAIRIPVNRIIINDRFRLVDHFISAAEFTRCSVTFSSETQINVTVVQSSFVSVFLGAIGEY